MRVESQSQLGRADSLQPVFLVGSIGAGLALARLLPGLAGRLSPLVNAGVFILIYLVMLGLDLRRVARALTHRRFLTIAIALNFGVNPVLAWLLGQVFLGNQPDLRVGLILFLVTPCIGWYLIFTELAGGDTALGVSLLGVNIVLQILLLPVYLLLFTGEAAAIHLATVVRSVLIFLLLPLGAAALTRAALARGGPGISTVQDAIDQRHLKTVVLMVIVVAMFASQAEIIFDNPGVVLTVLPAMAAFFVIAFAVALTAGRIFGLPHDQTALLAFTTVSRNSEASLAIAATAFASPLVGLTVVIGPVIELPILVLMVRVLLIGQRTTSMAPT